MGKKLNSFLDTLQMVFMLIGLIWMIEVINIALGHRLYIYGVYPRELYGLPGIILHPFIHGSLQHIIVNTVPLFVLGSFVATEGRSTFLRVNILIIVIGGTTLWALGRPSFHIGSSVLVFGYFGFILTNVFYRKTILAILISLVTIILYGGLIYGILPINNYTSWEGHLFSMIAGAISARLLHKTKNKN